MKKILFGFIIGFMLTLGVNVNAAEISGQFVKLFDSSTGGNLQTFNTNSVLNTKLGSEGGTTDNVGGTLGLYNGGEDKKRVMAGINKINDYGTINFYDKNSNPRAVIKADDKAFGPVFFLTNSDGKVATYVTTYEGYINNQRIATYDYVKETYVKKTDVQKMIDDAVQKALSK